MVSPEKIDLPLEEHLESKESPAREKWTKQASDLLKKFWFASLVVAIPSIAEAKEPVKFQDVWKTLTSGRSSGMEISSTVAERSGGQDQTTAYVRAYRSYNARLDSLLQLVPVKDLGVYLESYGVDFNSITPSQKDFRFLPIHEEESGCFASVVSMNPRTGKKGIIEFNTALLSPADTTLIQFISAHEMGHLIRRKEFFVPTPAIEEGLANWGAWKFMKDRLSKQGLDDTEAKARLETAVKEAYSGETLLAALIDNLYKNILKDYYTATTDPRSYYEIAEAGPKLNEIINKDLGMRGQLNSSEVLTVLRYLTSKYGMETVKKVYEELKTKYFLDLTEKKLGTLKWEGSLVYFDRTIKKPPFRTEGDIQISVVSDMVVRFKYIDRGLRRYEDILFQLKESLRTKDVSLAIIHVDPSMSLKETDGSLRKEIKEILESRSPEKMANK